MAGSTPNRISGIIDCACVIHGTGYSWQYVEHLYHMLQRVFDTGIRFHVYTEAERPVPDHMIKHELTPWTGADAPARSWWYKMQLFNAEYFSGNLLYLDLDVVVARELNFVRDCDPARLWAIRDFKYLQGRPNPTINSSMMWWNVGEFDWVWRQFCKENPAAVARRFPGDQDYISHVVSVAQRRFFDDRYFESYRWQCLDGGYDFRRRKYQAPGTGVRIAGDTAVVVFHGQPKPHQVHDPEIVTLWC